MRFTFVIAGTVHVAVDASPLPSGLDAVVLWMWGETFRAFGAQRQERLVKLAAEYSARTRRCVQWTEVDGGHAWCGPIAYGGDLHRDLWRALPPRTSKSGGVVALDWHTGRERPFAPPVLATPSAVIEADVDVDVDVDEADNDTTSDATRAA